MTTRRLARLRWGAIYVAGLALSVPSHAHAQAPVHEIQNLPPTIRRMIVSAARYYTTAKLWHNEARRRTDQFVKRAESLTRQRRALESRYMGNLGSFGGQLPRYNDLRGRCAADETLEDVCQGADFATGRGFERIIASTYIKWRDTVMVSVNRARDQSLEAVIGRGLEAENSANDILYGRNGLIRKFTAGEQRNHQAAAAMGQTYVAGMLLVQTATMGTIADSVNAWVTRLQDSVATDSTKLSEARALQLQLRASLAESWLMIAAVRGEVLNMEAGARNLQRVLAGGRLDMGLSRHAGGTP